MTETQRSPFDVSSGSVTDRARDFDAASAKLAEAHQLRPQRQDVLRRPADRDFGADACDRGRGGVPEAHAAGAIEEDDAVAYVRERERGIRAALGLAVEPRVLERDRGAGAELLRELEVGVVEFALLGDER